MSECQEQLQAIYLGQISEVCLRLANAKAAASNYALTKETVTAELSVLQMRKAMEAMAFASIAPHRAAYEAFRAEMDGDFRRDYNARRIFQALAEINPKFYPMALKGPTLQAELGDGHRHWHFDLRTESVLTKQQFESFYGRLGKYLHADNPWGGDKGLDALLTELPPMAVAMQSLLHLHATFVQAADVKASWVVEVPVDGPPKVLVGHASGDFYRAQ